MNKPLAEILRPQSLDEYIGQKHLVGEDAILRRAIESGDIPSLILWGPPGVGKTTLANIIANTLSLPFFALSAINSGVKEVREVIEQAKQCNNALLFVDEIHRFSKNQQDSLLGAVEQGIVRLIGATTENPSFEVIPPLLSRCQVYILRALETEDLNSITERAISYYKEEQQRSIDIKQKEALFRISGGDARKLMNAIELVVGQFKGDCVIDNALVQSIIQQNLAFYDKKSDMHYDIISAFIKSVRGSDPNAAVYWLARMIAGGEDPLFIARRMIILASEDIGNANPNALLLANACFDAVNKIGMPEGRIVLSQTAVYLATSPKSNSTYLAIGKALELVEKTGDLPVPLHLRNAPTKLMEQIGYGNDYKYSHDYQNHFVQQQFLPDALQTFELYSPCDNPREQKTREELRRMWFGVYKY